MAYQSSNQPYGNLKQQMQPYFSIPQHCWLLQQPHDSGYADGDEDLFAQAFKSFEPAMSMTNAWAGMRNTSALSVSSSAASSPFEYADSLVQPSRDWRPYETNYNATYSLDGSPYDLSSYDGASDCMVSAPTSQAQSVTQYIGLPVQAESPLPALLPSLMDDYLSLKDSPEPSVAGRPRQREHHTAVEQRYRKNLNQQFGNLRSVIPNIQTTQPQRGGQPAKPSKSEVLSGAVDYIRQLEEEVRRLKGATEDGTDQSRKRARTMG